MLKNFQAKLQKKSNGKFKGKLKPVVIFSILFLLLVLFDLYKCPVYSFIGYPCPGCFMTRAFFSLIKLDFARAFYFNPGIYVLLAAGIIVLIMFLLKQKRRAIESTIIITGIIVILIWGFRMIFMFNVEPFVHNDNSILDRVFHFFIH